MSHVSDVVAPYYVQQIANEKTRPVVPLLEVIELNPRKFSNPPTDDEPVSFVPMKAVEEESGHLDPSEVRPWSEVRKGYTPFEEGDVIFAKITPCMENGKYALAQGLIGGRAAGSTEFHVLRPKPSLDSKYLLYYLLRIELRQSARQSMRGAAGQLRVPPIFFESLSIPLPSLDEQHRIVAEIEERLSRLEAGVAALKRVEANLKRYRAAALAEMTHIDKKELPVGWRWSSVGELAQVGTGSTPKRDRRDYWQGGTVPWVTSSVVNRPTVTEPTEFITETALRETNCKVYPPGTLLVAMYGEGKTRGMCTELGVPAATNQALAAVQPSAELRPFLKRVLQASYERTRSAASGGVQPNLNLSHVRAIRVPLPPPDEQDRIVQEIDRRLSVVEELETQVRTDLARADRMRQAILSASFSLG